MGFVTHSTHMSSRLVTLNVNSIKSGLMEVVGPLNNTIYPPRPGWLYIINDGTPSKGKKVMVGDGNGPPVDDAVIANVLATTTVIAEVDAK